MKEYIEQFYNEGMATTFYIKPIKYFENKIKNPQIFNICKNIIKILYTIFVIVFAIFMFKNRLPF